MAEPSSISNSDSRDPAKGGFPWAFVLALLMLAGIELALRTQSQKKLIYYNVGELEYPAVTAYLDAMGAAEVSFVGSSRTREGIFVPAVRHACAASLTHKPPVANYACSAATLDTYEAITNCILRSKQKPRLLLVGLSPRDYRQLRPDWERLGYFYTLGEWWQSFRRSGTPALESLAPVIRHQAERHWWTLRYRRWFRQSVHNHFRPPEGVKVPSPIAGEMAPLQRKSKNHSMLNQPGTLEGLKTYVARELNSEGQFTFDKEMIDSLRRLVAACKAAGVDVVLFELPMPKILKETLPAEVYPKFLDLSTRIAREERVPFVTLEQLNVSLIDDDFLEYSHLNLAGAKKYTDVLVMKVIQPRLPPPKQRGKKEMDEREMDED